MIITKSKVLDNGTTEWTTFGELHRLDGPARIEPDGTVYYFQYGKLHRENGPAMILPTGIEYWYRSGRLHRIDGPAVYSPDHLHHRNIWFYRGDRIYTGVEFQQLTGIKNEELMMLILKYGEIK